MSGELVPVLSTELAVKRVPNAVDAYLAVKAAHAGQPAPTPPPIWSELPDAKFKEELE